MNETTRQPHGYGLDANLHQRLRGPVPEDAVRWVEATTGATVVAQRPLDGGNSSAVHLLILEGQRGADRQVVLRRYVLDWVDEEPWAPGNEALVLTLLNGSDNAIPAPRLLAADLDGLHTGAPAVLMSALPGRVEWQPSDMETWLRRLAVALPEIHGLPVSAELSD